MVYLVFVLPITAYAISALIGKLHTIVSDVLDTISQDLYSIFNGFILIAAESDALNVISVPLTSLLEKYNKLFVVSILDILYSVIYDVYSAPINDTNCPLLKLVTELIPKLLVVLDILLTAAGISSYPIEHPLLFDIPTLVLYQI